MDLPHTAYNRITMGFSRKFQNAGATFLLVIALAGAAARVWPAEQAVLIVSKKLSETYFLFFPSRSRFLERQNPQFDDFGKTDTKSMIYCKSPNFGFCRPKNLGREVKNKKSVSDDFSVTISIACSAGQTLAATPASAITKRNVPCILKCS